jgi:hypothetical protein
MAAWSIGQRLRPIGLVEIGRPVGDHETVVADPDRLGPVPLERPVVLRLLAQFRDLFAVVLLVAAGHTLLAYLLGGMSAGYPCSSYSHRQVMKGSAAEFRPVVRWSSTRWYRLLQIAARLLGVGSPEPRRHRVCRRSAIGTDRCGR